MRSLLLEHFEEDSLTMENEHLEGALGRHHSQRCVEGWHGKRRGEAEMPDK